MDTSEIYIKMCEQATEIQKEWQPQPGDYYLHNYRGTTGFTNEQEQQIWGDSNDTWRQVEILCYKPSKDNDILLSTAKGESCITSSSDLVRHHCVFIPRQDQLQEMVKKESIGTLIDHFITWYYKFSEKNPEILPEREYTMEQLWLAYVMKEKYNKTWNGSEWTVKANALR